MSKAATRKAYRIWGDLDGADGWCRRSGTSALQVIVRYVGETVGDFGFENLSTNYWVREEKRGGKVARFRLTMYRGCTGGDEGLGIDALYCCRKCGCTEDDACEGGCSWAGPSLCSACAR